MHNYFYQIIRLLIIALLFCNPAFAQQTNPHSKTISKFDSIRNNFPREKLYVQIDKSLYAPQDTLWFKAYLVNASTLEASKISGLIYFEMFDSEGNNIQRICLPTAMGLTWGAFALKPDLYKTGTYTFRAYTNWMQNFGDSYIFKKEIKIADFFTDENTYVADKKKPSVAKTQNTVSTSKANDFDIQFLPEGGNWTSNVMQKMAFKAINSLGKGVQVSGEVFDSKQNKIVDFHSNDKGMGYFNMMPAANETYTANIKLNETAKKQNLPKTSQSASFLKVTNDFRSDSLAINMFADLPNQEITMMGQSRGNLCFIAKFNSGIKYNTVRIAKSIFPTGVCQIMLINGKNQVINERNLFINHKDELKIQLRSEQTEYHTRDSICISLTANTFLSKPVSGSFSVAVTDDNQVSKDSLNDNNILSQFLLASDLKGEIETPGYYFNNFNEQKHNDLEALMLTQAWVSYNWESTKKPVFKAEKDFTISGRITNMLNKPGVNAQILLLGTRKPISVTETTTNANGEFEFKDFPALDSASYVIQVKNSRGKSGTLGIALNDAPMPPFLIDNTKDQAYGMPSDTVTRQFIATKNEEYKAAYRNGIVLREVKIMGKRIIKGSKNLNGSGNADITLTEEDLDKVAKKTLYHVLEETIKGFRKGVRPKTRPPIPDFFINGAVFKLVIDGMDVDRFYQPVGSPSMMMTLSEHYEYIKTYLDYYDASDIKGIEVMTSSKYSTSYTFEYAQLSSEVQYAFVEVTTRSGQGPFLRKNSNLYRYKPPTYGDNKVFYSPKYNAAYKEHKTPDYRSTVYWNPHLSTNETGKIDFSFFSADKKGSYTVWIEGTDMNGNFGFKTMKLEIK